MATKITGYCMATHKKNVPMKNVKIRKLSNGAYMATGDDGKGHKMTSMLSAATAQAALKDGSAKKG